MSQIQAIEKCRVSGSAHLVSVLNLGQQSLTGVFPRRRGESVTEGPLELVWCPDSGLLQLKHSYSLEEMYGDNYGYRSGLNHSMVTHLRNKVRSLERQHPLASGDWVLDIGSNDGTLLGAYSTSGIRRVGIDPTANKFREHYPADVLVVPSFFSANAFLEASSGTPAKIISSIAMFYDLEDPAAFVRDIAKSLHPEGIWHFEQSYMPSMLRTNAYDTVCHEHIEYYSLGVIRNLLQKCGLRIVSAQVNGINGGSIAITACHQSSVTPSDVTTVEWMLEQEEHWGLHTPKPYRDFEERVFKHRADLQRLVRGLNRGGKRVLGYGASTKGNVLLQFCGFGEDEIPAIAEINPFKFGAFTPGTHIPIVSESDAMEQRPDYLLVLPWHFKSSILERERDFLASGGKLIFPLPEIEIVGD